MARVNGLHHITAIAGPAQENLDFYAGVLGMRLVKKSINQDDPGTYHLFYADAEGHPGSDLTFFPWAHLAPSRIGHGLAVEVALGIPPDTLTFWGSRLEKYGAQIEAVESRFGERVLPIVDPHGLRVSLVEASTPRQLFTPWDGGPVEPSYQIRGLHGARLWERELAPTTKFLTGALGFEVRRRRPGVARGASAASTISRGAWTTTHINSPSVRRPRPRARTPHRSSIGSGSSRSTSRSPAASSSSWRPTGPASQWTRIRSTSVSRSSCRPGSNRRAARSRRRCRR
jgi:catechol 2,3-dioxygenase-like lactoylglutathione lyase family enzyme